jgi:hypothetical protein
MAINHSAEENCRFLKSVNQCGKNVFLKSVTPDFSGRSGVGGWCFQLWFFGPSEFLDRVINRTFPNPENTHRPATNFPAGHWMPSASPSSQAMRWSLTNTQWRTATISRSHYKPFAGISQRVFTNQ